MRLDNGRSNESRRRKLLLLLVLFENAILFSSTRVKSLVTDLFARESIRLPEGKSRRFAVFLFVFVICSVNLTEDKSWGKMMSVRRLQELQREYALCFQSLSLFSSYCSFFQCELERHAFGFRLAFVELLACELLRLLDIYTQ